FEEKVLFNPDGDAVIFEDQRVTYAELNQRANQLAHLLQNKGVRKDTLVAVCIERSVEMIVAIIGILKAGGAYVPIDPDYPLERINYLLDDSDAKIAITSNQTKLKLAEETSVDIIQL